MQFYLPIAELPVDVLRILFTGAAVGFIAGLFGVGGGFLITTLLIFLGIPPAVAAVRLAVRRALPAEGLVLVACSGGADSLALAAAARFVGASVGLVTVDHGLQAGSAGRATELATWASSAGNAEAWGQSVRWTERPPVRPL